MKKLVIFISIAAFVLSGAGVSFAQSASSTAQEKASENAAFIRGDEKPTPKPNQDKVKAGKEKAVHQKAAKEQGAKQKAAKEKSMKENQAKTKAQSGKEKLKLNPEEPKKQ